LWSRAYLGRLVAKRRATGRNVRAAASLVRTLTGEGFTMGMFQEFKEFIGRGNVVDLAVGVIMGAAFGKIVNSVVNDVIMPPIGYIIGGIDFKDLAFELPKKTIQIPDVADPTKMVDKVLGPVSIKYGNLIQMTFEFLIVAFAVFLLVKAVNTVMKKKAAEPAAPPAQEVLLTEIRDLLKKR
jgi:large conductance mechanosensitive channel